MKRLRLLVTALALVASLIPAFVSADQIYAPLEKKIPAGTTTIVYAEQVLKFTTPAPLKVVCEELTPGYVQVSMVVYPGTQFPNGPASYSYESVTLYWANYSTTVYEGSVPISDPWVGVLATEGGFVDR